MFCLPSDILAIYIDILGAIDLILSDSKIVKRRNSNVDSMTLWSSRGQYKCT